MIRFDICNKIKAIFFDKLELIIDPLLFTIKISYIFHNFKIIKSFPIWWIPSSIIWQILSHPE